MFYVINRISGTIVSSHRSEKAATKQAGYEDDFLVNLNAGEVDSGLDQLSVKQLVTLYNAVTGEGLKRFSNKAQGVARTYAALAEHKPSRKADTGGDDATDEGAEEKTEGRKSAKVEARIIYHIEGAADNKRWKLTPQPSMRKRCFDEVGEGGITVAEYLENCSQVGIGRGHALACLQKMSEESPTRTLLLEDPEAA